MNKEEVLALLKGKQMCANPKCRHVILNGWNYCRDCLLYLDGILANKGQRLKSDILVPEDMFEWKVKYD
jgi:hypothetical protein